jgi:hypothetical protein
LSAVTTPSSFAIGGGIGQARVEASSVPPMSAI